MDSAAWLADDDPIVGVVDPDPDAIDPEADRDAVTAIDAALVDRDASIATGTVEEVLAAAPSMLVAIREAGLTAVARAEPDAPVLPIGPVPGVETVPVDAIEAGLGAVLDGDAVERDRPLLGVEREPGSTTSGSDRKRALFDVTLVTEEPARISEYSVRSRGESIAQFRADGVVVATPAGSYGYASAVDVPRLSAAVDAVGVAPIAPFVTATRRWVLPADDLALAVERDEGDVSLLADDRIVETISPGERVTVGVDGTLATLVVPESSL
ncbi:NAD(+)/NADH kinase [Halosolutus amylolyticus]|uniref:NAD(+)/NADH kinase n=1 Tax=Halosolutus amylolyticus TaxID=2932267 RepID=A0ABD5PTT4_9EURY|nr:NAD(+)/NADH kinase [Halosolutus amylolyticus]